MIIKIETVVIPANYGQNAEKTVLLDGEKTATQSLKTALATKSADEVVKVILRSEKGVAFEHVQEILTQLDDVYLANYLYE